MSPLCRDRGRGGMDLDCAVHVGDHGAAYAHVNRNAGAGRHRDLEVGVRLESGPGAADGDVSAPTIATPPASIPSTAKGAVIPHPEAAAGAAPQHGVNDLVLGQ